jgi:TrpR-related protein YerC/YecD
MTNSVDRLWKEENAAQLVRALLAIADAKTMQNFLRDVLTEKEIIEISARLEAARMLRQGKTYAEIIAKTNLSSRTVARIKEWMENGAGGYEVVLNQIEAHQTHIPPARA